MLKVVHVITSPCGGGAELLVRELVSRMNTSEIESSAVYFNTQPPCANDIRLRSNEFSLNTGARSLKAILLLRELISKMRRNDKDLIVHVHLTWPFFFVPIALIGLSVKLIFTEHSTTNKRRNIPLMWVFERLFYLQYEKIICISEGVKNTLGYWVGPRIRRKLVIIHNGSRIYPLIERPPLNKRLPYLVSIGSLTRRKNFSTLIKAIAYLENEIESYTIVGDGPERQQLEQRIEYEHLEKKIKLLGWTDDIETHLHMADIQLIPSLWEGFGLVAVEGMSTGLPVVASNVEGLREVLNESNPSVTFVQKPESVDEWVSSIRSAIAAIRLQGINTLARSSRQQAEKFTLNKMAEGYLNVYRQVTARQNEH